MKDPGWNVAVDINKYASFTSAVWLPGHLLHADSGHTFGHDHSVMKSLTQSSFDHKLFSFKDPSRVSLVPKPFPSLPSSIFLHMCKTCIIRKGLGTRVGRVMESSCPQYSQKQHYKSFHDSLQLLL